MPNFLQTTGHWSKAWNAKRSTFLTRELRNTRANVEAQYAAWISAGYTIYDIPAEGGLTYLSGKAAGNYLCVWKTLEPAYLVTPDTGTATAGAATTITLAAGASAVDDYYNGMVIEILTGTGSGQFNIIKDYDGTSKVATVTTWGVNPDNTSQYKIGDYDKILNADISPHTSIIITGIKINTYNKIEKIDLESKIDFSNNGVAIVCEFWYMNITKMPVIVNPCKFFKFSNITIDCNADTTQYINDSLFYNVNINFNDHSISVVDCNYENVNFDSIYIINTGDSVFTNCIINDSHVSLGVSTNVDFDNTVFIDSQFDNSGASALTKNIIYLQGDIVFNGEVNNYLFINTHPDRQTFIPDSVTFETIDTTDTTGLMTDANYQSLDTLISTSLANVRVTGGQYSRRFYEMAFKPNNAIDADFKTMFAREQSLLVIWRDDLDETFVTDTGGARKIKNLAFYENDGTTAYDYRNNENFLILTEDADGNEVTFAWYQGLVYGTYFSDFWDDTTYTIKRIFQILEPPENLTWRNILPYADSPIECSASFKEMVSVFVDSL